MRNKKGPGLSSGGFGANRRAPLGRVLTGAVSHNFDVFRDGANVGKLALTGRSACERE